MKKTIFQNLIFILFIIVVSLTAISLGSEGIPPIADAGLPRYAAWDPVVLDGTDSYDPDNSGPLSYNWQQLTGPIVVITDANTATPTISGFIQTDEIQECEFELVVSDGKLTSRSNAVKVIIVPDFGENMLRLTNDTFDPNKPTVIAFQGGDCVVGGPYQVASVRVWDSHFLSLVNVINFHEGYEPDTESYPRTYYNCGDMIIVYLSTIAPDYQQPIQTLGLSTGGQPAVDVGIRLNLTYQDARYAVNHVTLLDAGTNCRSYQHYSESIADLIANPVDGEQCWLDNYVSKFAQFYPSVLNVGFDSVDHTLSMEWYDNTWTLIEWRNNFNHGVVAGAYWHVVGPGKNFQLAWTPERQTYKFKWYGGRSSGYLDFYDENNHPGKLPEPVTLVGPENGVFIDANGAVFSCKVSENAVGYQLLFGPHPYRVMDYYVISDTSNPPTEVITSSPFEQTWWTVKVYDQYGSTIYADPIMVNFENLTPPMIENITTGQRYNTVQRAINDAGNGHEIVVIPGVYKHDIDFQGKKLTLRSIDPNDSDIVSKTVITAEGVVVTFSGGEDANCVLAGFTITGGKRGIYCLGASPTILNCIISRNSGADMGAGMYLKNGSSPVLVNCTFSDNLASMTGGGIQNWDSSPTLINCSFSGNSATYLGGGVYCAGGTPVLTNCILWGDTPDEVFIFSGTPVITYSDIQGGWEGEGNIDADPLFADAANGDYHLKSQAGRWDPVSQSWIVDDVSSPCIDAGDPKNPVSAEPLPNGNIINMGAYGGTTEASKSP